MKHVKPVSCHRPATAQLQIWLDILSLITATLQVVVTISQIFGIDLNKNDEEEPEV